ncbi:MAG: adenylosuccinate synthetase [Candidatus Competibacteraceae bacterium]|nr:adenylosuccinate synthetase [Candidatus Competibacteraceae bacterium]
MKQAQVIIGSGYGDEGKGLATDFYAAQFGEDALVVRFNGGAQAGHTVATPEGQRQVFSHIGSGSLTGAATYLSRFFVCHPMLFLSEYQQLEALGVTPRVYVDGACPITTPFDVMFNQKLEESRGVNRHGSCGLGFGETLERHQHAAFRLVAADLNRPDCVVRILRAIRDHYVPQRLKALGLPGISDVARLPEIIERFVEDCRIISSIVRITDARILRTRFQLVFEGAQGLLLDMDRGTFPYVTRSNTGLKNVVTLAEEMGINELSVSYVSRWHATRHGAGPLPFELGALPYEDFEDHTNRPNAWQGSLRFGLLDADTLIAAVRADLADAGTRAIRHEWLITWADKAPSDLRFVTLQDVVERDLDELAYCLATGTGAEAVRFAVGENRDKVTEAMTMLPTAAVIAA